MSQPTPTPLEYAATPLRREIGLGGAVLLGLGAILGSGVFVGLPIATTIAGPWVLLAILLAGGLAYCNAMSSAQLAAAHPVAGGTYEYGYRLLSPAWGFTAGWTFLLAKSASAATAALAAAQVLISSLFTSKVLRYPPPTAEQATTLAEWVNAKEPLATTVGTFALVIGITASIFFGLRRTMLLNLVLVSLTLIGLSAYLVLFGVLVVETHAEIDLQALPSMGFSVSQLAHSAALCFVAFTGYGRLATLGEEVRQPSTTIPAAIKITLSLATLLYFAVGMTTIYLSLWMTSGFQSAFVLTDWAAPVSRMAASERFASIVYVAALTALLGVLLNLVLGLSRVWLAMGRRGDMPYVLGRVNRRGVPVPATIVSGILIALLVFVGRDVRTTWSFSAFSVLIYYAITNLACMRLPAEQRRYPRSLAWIGLASCLSLAWFVDWTSIVVGTGLIAVGLLWHFMRRSDAREPQPI